MENEGTKYDLIAAEFAAMRDSFNTKKKYLDSFIELLSPNSHILDVGCGSGYPIASYLIEKGFRLTGIDASKELLKIAKKNCPTMKLVTGDIRTITLEEKYDAIIEWWCLFHIPRQDQINVITRFSSWLKPGGIVEFTTGDRDHEETSSAMLEQELHFYSNAPEIYEKCLKQNNFKILSRESDQEQHLVWIVKHQG